MIAVGDLLKIDVGVVEQRTQDVGLDEGAETCAAKDAVELVPAAKALGAVFQLAFYLLQAQDVGPMCVKAAFRLCHLRQHVVSLTACGGSGLFQIVQEAKLLGIVFLPALNLCLQAFTLISKCLMILGHFDDGLSVAGRHILGYGLCPLRLTTAFVQGPFGLQQGIDLHLQGFGLLLVSP